MKSCIKILRGNPPPWAHGRVIRVPFKKVFFPVSIVYEFSGDIYEFLWKPFSMSEFAGFKNIDMCKEEKNVQGKALAEYQAKNASFFWRAPLGKPQKKIIFLVARPLRPLAFRNFFPYIKKFFFP